MPLINKSRLNSVVHRRSAGDPVEQIAGARSERHCP